MPGFRPRARPGRRRPGSSLDEIERIRKEKVSQEELETVKNSAI